MNLIKTISYCLIGLLSLNSFASDHIDGPVTKEHGVADLSDLFAFPTPNNKERLSLVLNTYPLAPTDAHFSKKVKYKFTLKTMDINFDKTQFKYLDTAQIICTITEKYHHNHKIHCDDQQGNRISSVMNTITENDSFRVFAGLRSDPFFFNLDWVKDAIENGKIGKADESNAMDKLNALSIVLDFDIKKLFPTYNNDFIAVTAQAIANNNQSMDWIGRPEITNFSLATHNREELRDLYNQEIPFQKMINFTKYFKRLVYNIGTYYDGQDGNKDWNHNDVSTLANILLYDHLIIAPHLDCSQDSFFDIEAAMMAYEKAQTCGGRKLTDDISDRLLSYYIGRDLNLLDDGVDRAYREISEEFPYLNEPDTSLSARLKAWAARKLK